MEKARHDREMSVAILFLYRSGCSINFEFETKLFKGENKSGISGGVTVEVLTLAEGGSRKDRKVHNIVDLADYVDITRIDINIDADCAHYSGIVGPE